MNLNLGINEQLSVIAANGLSGVFINGTSLYASLSSAGGGNKIFFDNQISGISGQNDLSVVRLSADQYAQMLDDGTCLSNAIYIVDTPEIDAFKQQIKNVAPPTDLSDAATKEYVDNALANVQIPTDLSSFTNSPGYITSSSISSKLDISAAFPEWRFEPYTEGYIVSYNGKIWKATTTTIQTPGSGNQWISVDIDSILGSYAKTSNIKNNTITVKQGDETKGSFTLNQASDYTLSLDVGSHVFFDDRISGISGKNDLSVIKLSADEYASLLTSDAIVSNCIYIVEDEYTNAYGRQIKNIADPTDLSDAATKKYVDDAIPNDLSDLSNSPGYITSASISASLADIQKSVFEPISNPAASVRSLQETLISVLNILRG